MAQNQDLVLFSDNSIIPEINFCSLITHTQGTSPSWLVDVLIENGLYNTCAINHEKKQRKTAKADVMFISLLHDSKFYDLKRIGVELGEVKEFHFVDLFTDLFTKVTDVESVSEIFDQLASQLSSYTNKDKVVLIEGIEFLLASTAISSTQLLNQIIKLQKKSTALFIVSSADKELIDVKVNNVQLPEFKTNDFLLRFIHRSHLVISLRPLDTGRAKDVTGTLTISRGALPLSNIQVLEKEYLFFVSRDQPTKLFFR
jgi:elongator complex protein 6